MKKFNLFIFALLLIIFTQSAFSLPYFNYREIVTTPEGDLITSTNYSDYYVDLRITLFEGSTQLFQQYYSEEWVNEFGFFDVGFGGYYDQGESLWVDISDIVPTPETRIKVEIYDYNTDNWYTVSYKHLSESVRYLYYNYFDVYHGDGDNNGNKETSKTNGTNKNSNKQLKSNFMPVPNRGIERPLLPSNSLNETIMIIKDITDNLNFPEGTPGQKMILSNAAEKGTIYFAGVNIEPGETYQFLFTGKTWSRIK